MSPEDVALLGVQHRRGRKARPFDVRSRAPLRLGLAGGGTDLSPYCDQFGGAVLNATIDRFAFAHVTPNDEGRVVFRARDIGADESHALDAPIALDQGLVLHRGVYRHMVETYLDGRMPALTVSTTIDAPAGSGLGSSSALVVALVEAFRAALDLPLGPAEIARLAFDIERNQLGLAGGRQDHYAAAFGGVNFIEFLPGEKVLVSPLRVPRAFLNEFESSLVICFTGQSRRSETIIQEQIDGLRGMDARTIDSMHQLKADAALMREALLQGDMRGLAEILTRSWAAKQRTAKGIATPAVERLFQTALDEGAWGGKVSGAGGGGFLMFFTDPENRHRLITALNAAGGQASPAKITFEGAEAWGVPR
ncbi:GHMP family kinase ATP-binding protein [Caulobacter hibisci]|uniref:Dehydrogenase n=1 Tax=Caulobacter hibisci TaxID=2035993 RepID=A0ABS0SV50_9CAUL|nr:dehydrogenase [Caulobacter hibisci]MBI1682815.1 dehydrogenase [Caulobacter hibisci]